jgi:hypothetical protein
MTILTCYPGILGPAVNPLSMPAGSTSGLQVLIPVQDPADGGSLDVGGLLAPASGTILQFASTGTERLLVIAATSGVTVTVTVQSLILGQPVSSFPPVTLTEGHLYAFGPFHSVLQIPGTSTIQVSLSVTTDVSVLLVQGVPR